MVYIGWQCHFLHYLCVIGGCYTVLYAEIMGKCNNSPYIKLFVTAEQKEYITGEAKKANKSVSRFCRNATYKEIEVISRKNDRNKENG